MSTQPEVVNFEELLAKKHAEEQQKLQSGSDAKKTSKKPLANLPAITAALSVGEVLALDAAKPEMLIESVLPTPGASLVVGAAKSGKTVLALQQSIAVARGTALFGFYRAKQGPVMVLEQDDPAGPAGLKDILVRAGVSKDAPLYIQPRVPLIFGHPFLEWLGQQIAKYSLTLVVLDSYTALRGARGAGVDIVKAEQSELALLDNLAKATRCAIVIIHHTSKGSASLDWSEKAAGTFAMGAATEAQIFLTRFTELDAAAPERLVRVRGRHFTDVEMVLRFRAETLDYEHVLEGGAAPIYPAVLQIKHAFGDRTFTPKDLLQQTLVSRPTAFRQIERLCRAGALRRCGHGEYALADLR